MFGSIGITELILIAGIALMVLGPDKFPEFAKLAMRSMRDVRKYVADAQHEIAKELDPMKKSLNEVSKIDPEAYLDNLIGDNDDDDDADDDGSVNLEPELTPEELQSATQDLSEDWDGDVDMSDSKQEHVTSEQSDAGKSNDSISQDELVQYNPYGEESEGADPYGTRAGSAHESELSEEASPDVEEDRMEEDTTGRLDG
ncbi:MAG: hypothetical protein COA73_00095 [Candidatus Hydrogenedentota bacterium]|nr:MAG: hypothetical protein COA73_00095 [Candidatus Hydrogenedentota bacterium]